MNGLQITLSAESETASVNYDFIELYYKKNDKYYLVDKYGGNLKSKVLLVPSLDFYIYWKTDSSQTKYGFKISSISSTNSAVESTAIYIPKSLSIIEVNGRNYPETKHPYTNGEQCIWHYTSENLSYCEPPSLYGATIGEHHTVDDWGLQLVDVVKGDPTAKRKKISVVGRNGDLDLTKSLTGSDTPKFGNRPLTLTFVLIDKSMARWATMDSIIKNYCHGKTMDIIIDSDPGWYWRGTCSVSTTKEDAIHSRFVIDVDAEPFKYDVNSTDGDWLWDSLNFETGIIREYSNIEVSGSKSIKVIGTAIEVVPTITVSTAMSVRFNNVTYQLKAGSNKVSDIIIREGENTLTFTGTGTVTIIYKGVSL